MIATATTVNEKPPRRHYDGRTDGTTDVWITPKYILEALGKFDLDPAAASKRPWPTATHHYTLEDNGLYRPWFGRVWLNPPYGRILPVWLERLNQHGDGIALVASRTDSRWFHRLVFNSADGIFFIKGRISFCQENGEPFKHPGFPSCLVAYGQSNMGVLRNLNGEDLNGRYLDLKMPS